MALKKYLACVVLSAMGAGSTFAVSGASVPAVVTQRVAVRGVGDYVLNFDVNAKNTHENRRLNGVSLVASTGAKQVAKAGSAAEKLVYTNSEAVFTAKAGETLAFSFDYTGNWMYGYVYLDKGNDGTFDVALTADGLPEPQSDLMTFSGYNSKNSVGGAATTDSPTPPAFTLPSTLAPGTYRLRFKVDWDNVDAGGNVSENNSIMRNGGGIIDALLRVHDDEVNVTQTAQTHGSLVAADGTALAGRVPFGKPLAIRAAAEAGYRLSGVKVRHGYGLDGDAYVRGNRQWKEEFVPAFLFRNGTYTLTAEQMDGDVRLEGVFVEATTSAVGTTDYPRVVDDATLNGKEGASLGTFILSTGGVSTRVPVKSQPNNVYRDLLNKKVAVKGGDVVTLTMNYRGTLDAYLYIDYDEDGQFTPELSAEGVPTGNSELVTFSRYGGKNSAGEAVTDPQQGVGVLPTFTIPAGLPNGFYRARLKVDAENIAPEGSATIVADGGYIVDFLLNVNAGKHTLDVQSVNGSLHGTDYAGLPAMVTVGQALTYRPQAITNSYKAKSVRVKHGHRFDGPQYVRGNRQWSEYDVPITTATTYALAKDSVDGDVVLSVDFQPTTTTDYRLVFNDEFNDEDGTQPNSVVWRRTPREGATWNRYMDDSKDVIYQKDGKLVARAISNPNATDASNTMLTGGVDSYGGFAFKYGKIEARILTNPHSGSFPAFWLMPVDGTGGWPKCGEIDIWEAIDALTETYHTVHSHWTYTLGNKSNPASSRTVGNVPQDAYHTFGLEWDENQLRWYVDGKHVHTYAKSVNPSDLENGQWPFDKEFYIILNQSVGNGSWAKNPDPAYTYETLFDWVRVYQLPEQIVGIERVSAEPSEASKAIYDLTGRRVTEMQKGVYIINGKKVVR